VKTTTVQFAQRGVIPRILVDFASSNEGKGRVAIIGEIGRKD
jgi:hypothetical protein